jgi:isopenicillin N synthase-like dioxygenase
MKTLPTIDIAAFLADPNGASGRACAERLRDACHDPGFCYVAGHGVPAPLEAAVMSAARDFFELPQAERHSIAIARSAHFRGYTVLGDERTKGISDWRDQLDIGPEEAAPPISANDPPWLRLRGPNQWPPSQPQLRVVMLEWMASMESLALSMLRALALGLGQPIDHFDSVMLPGGDTHVKVIRYPAQIPSADTGQGVGMHHDSGLLSFVLQDAVGGLQVQTADGIIDATPCDGTYVLNIAEMLQAATSGYLSATKHRVQSPPAGRERIAIAYFANPRLECEFGPIELPEALAAAARGGQNPDPNDPVFSTFGDNYLKIRLRAHPDVAAAHYADLGGQRRRANS